MHFVKQKYKKEAELKTWKISHIVREMNLVLQLI